MLPTYLKTRAQSTSWTSFKTRRQIAWGISWPRSSAECIIGTISFLARTGTSTLFLIHFLVGSPLSPVNSLLIVGVRSKLIRLIFVDGRPSNSLLLANLIALPNRELVTFEDTGLIPLPGIIYVENCCSHSRSMPANCVISAFFPCSIRGHKYKLRLYSQSCLYWIFLVFIVVIFFIS